MTPPDSTLADLVAFVAAGAAGRSAPSEPQPRATADRGGQDPLDFLGGDLPDDFLQADLDPGRPAAASGARVALQRGPPDRRVAATSLVESLGAEPPRSLASVVNALEQCADLVDTDLDGAWAALAAVAAAEGEAVAVTQGRLSRLVLRALGGGAADVGLLAAEAVRRLGLAEQQDAVAALLVSDAAGLGFRGVELVLDCLAEVGDGRCVRTMEAALVSASGALTEHQAWRARHIVQLIRRDRRR